MNVFSGKAGSGKSPVIKTILAFLRMLFNKRDINSNIVKVTAYTGVAADPFKMPGATTIHGAAHFNYKSPKRQSSDWVNTIIVFIDIISFMSTPTCEKPDRRIRIQTGKTEELFGGIHINFAGDFFQIPPVCEESKVIYNGYCLQWSSLTAGIRLENNHKFVKDLNY